MAELLVLVPFYISAWGVGYYGEWLTLTIIPSMLAFADLGFGSSIANTLILKYHAQDYEGANRIAKGGFRLITKTVIGSIFVSGVVLIVMVELGLFKKSLIPQWPAVYAISCLMLARILDFYQYFFDGYFRSNRKAAESVNLSSVYYSSRLVSSWLVLFLKGGIIEFGTANLIVSILYNSWYAQLAKRQINLSFTNVQVDPTEMKTIVKKGLAYLMSPIWQSIFFQGTTLVVRITLGPVAVAVFNTVRTVTRSLNQLFDLIGSTIFPELQYQIGSGSLGKARQVFRVSLAFAFFSSLAGVAVLSFIAPIFYDKWTHNALHPPSSMWYIFYIGIVLNSLWWTGLSVFWAFNKPGGFTFAGLIGAVISVAISFVLAKYFGLIGAAIGSLSLEVVMVIYILPASCKLLQQSLKTFLRELLDDIVKGAAFKIRKNYAKN